MSKLSNPESSVMIRFKPETKQALIRLSIRHNRSQTSLVSEILENWLKEHPDWEPKPKLPV